MKIIVAGRLRTVEIGDGGGMEVGTKQAMRPPMSSSASAGIEPFDILTPAGEVGPLVFASPHSGTERPADFRPAVGLTDASLRSAEDALVDQLIAAGPAHGAPVILGRISRAYVDVNRCDSELDPALITDCPPGELSAKTAAGFGVVPRRAGDGASLYDRRLSMAEVEGRLDAVHRPYHAALARLMEAAKARHGVAILIDWHSMPARATEGRTGARAAPGAEVVLGDRHGSACDPGLTRRLRWLFETAGWRVGMNAPYAGGYSTQIWGRPADGFQAIQIELSRALYMDEATMEPTAGFARCKAVLDEVIAKLTSETITV